MRQSRYSSYWRYHRPLAAPRRVRTINAGGETFIVRELRPGREPYIPSAKDPGFVAEIGGVSALERDVRSIAAEALRGKIIDGTERIA